MSQYHTINAGETERFFTVVARADGSPITTGTVNYYLKAKSGANNGKWYRNSDSTWQVAETANAMVHEADGHWEMDLTTSPFSDSVRYLEYVKESGNLHIPDARHLVGRTADSVQTGDSFARIGANGAGLSAVPWPAAWDAEVQSEVDDALVARGLDHLINVAVVGADIADNSIIARLASKSATADWDSFVNTDDSLEAIRDRGDAAWVTATGFSTHSAADVWASAARTLTQSVASPAGGLTGTTLTIVRGDTLAVTFSGLGSLAARADLWFTAKLDRESLDSAALILVSETSGLEVMNGAAPGDALNGSLVVNDQATGNLTVTVAALEMAKLATVMQAGFAGYYDLQIRFTSGVVRTLTSGRLVITADVTRATS